VVFAPRNGYRNIEFQSCLDAGLRVGATTGMIVEKLALGFLMFRPQSLFGEKIVERV